MLLLNNAGSALRPKEAVIVNQKRGRDVGQSGGNESDNIHRGEGYRGVLAGGAGGHNSSQLTFTVHLSSQAYTGNMDEIPEPLSIVLISHMIILQHRESVGC